MLQPFIGLIGEPVMRLGLVLMDNGSGCLKK